MTRTDAGRRSLAVLSKGAGSFPALDYLICFRAQMMTWLRLIVATIGGIISTAALFVGMAAGRIELTAIISRWKYPHDLSAGDSAGWIFVFASPVLLPIFGMLSAAGGIGLLK
jgi:hypothetical protein